MTSEATTKRFTMPGAELNATSLRDLFTQHLQSLASDYNKLVEGRQHYIRTGELTVEWDFRPEHPKMSRGEREGWIRRLEHTKVVLPDFTVGSDADFVAAVLAATLALRVPYFGIDQY